MSTIGGALVVWAAAALTVCVSGRLEQFTSSTLLIAGTVPASAYLMLYRVSRSFRERVLSLVLKFVTLVQAGRILGGAGFLIGYWLHLLPGWFALTTGITDIAVGVTAIPVASYVSSQPKAPTRWVRRWHAFGMALLLVSSTLGVLTGPTTLGVLASDITSQATTSFPYNLVPTFFGPLTMICHILALQQVCAGNQRLRQAAEMQTERLRASESCGFPRFPKS